MKTLRKKAKQHTRGRILTALRQTARSIFLKDEHAAEGPGGISTETRLGVDGLNFGSVERTDLLYNSASSLGISLAAIGDMGSLHADEGETIGDFAKQLERALSLSDQRYLTAQAD